MIDPCFHLTACDHIVVNYPDIIQVDRPERNASRTSIGQSGTCVFGSKCVDYELKIENRVGQLSLYFGSCILYLCFMNVDYSIKYELHNVDVHF